MSRARLAALGPLVLLAGCSLAPPTDLPEPPVPQTWPAGDAYLAQRESDLPTVSYESVFTDPRLRALVGQALANNRDLRVAAANVAAARAQVRATRANQFPEIGVTGSATYRGTGDNGTPRTGTGGGTGANIVGRDGMSYSLQGGVSSYEIDLFGRLANATRAERQRALASEAAARTVRLGLVADLANAWATYAADRELLGIAQATADNARRSIELTRARLEGGVAPRTDLRQAEQVLTTAQGDIAEQTARIAQDENLIRLLVGAAFDKSLLPSSLAEVTASFSPLAAGTSSEVLLRRPDVIEAEYALRAADFDIGTARAALFPAISLTGVLGFASDALSSLFDGDAFSYTAGGNLSAPLFDAGRRGANVDIARARREAALATYEGTIQTAFREVADALADQGTLAERLRAARAFTAAAADTARLTEARYRGGIDSYLTSLDAQRSEYAARRAEIATLLALAANRVTVYRVLGGDLATPVSEPE
ncbi:transporter [Novosphingobium sp. PC22D]|uniref:efflux transporter outer membrane subunit n=1 Tax=Novosphingobium sp. PC22D TaxID=1962403 RepID=UPI000BF01ADC|nr:efflux transporter outer membrane subunit [Novosphingobium sp. PC22D]PEQ13707.1 transporter [Novosphingobium sp. PC22D]